MPGDSRDERSNERLGLLIVASTALPPALVAGLIGLLGGPVVAVVVFVVVAVGLAAAVWTFAEARALAGVGGVPADPRAHARLYNLVDGLCAAAGVAPPRLVVVEDPALNALAIGRDPRHAVLALTTGLLSGLSRIELEGVLANELVRIKRRDTLPGTLAAAAGPLGRRLARPIEEEESVDLAAVALTRYPPGLASALEKMATAGTSLAHPASSVVALWLAEPRSRPDGTTLSDRRPLAERVAALARALTALRRLTRRRIAVVAATGLALTGCGSAHHKAAPVTTTPTSTTSTTAAPTTTTVPKPTTTKVPPPVYPLTGLPATNAANLHRPALVVKIDNVPAARPQTGLASADVVYEEMVEGGVTRLAAVFQSADTAPLGPIRSGRTTDIAIVSDLNTPLFAFSGANARFLAEIRASPIIDVDAEREGPRQYYRMGPHQAPDNLYSSTQVLYALAPGATNAPPPLFDYRSAGTPVRAAGAVPTIHASLGWPLASATWDWNAATGTWLRGQNGTADVDAANFQLRATNVVIQSVGYTTDGEATGEGLPPVPIPEGELVGSGTAWILSGAR